MQKGVPQRYRGTPFVFGIMKEKEAGNRCSFTLAATPLLLDEYRSSARDRKTGQKARMRYRPPCVPGPRGARRLRKLCRTVTPLVVSDGKHHRHDPAGTTAAPQSTDSRIIRHNHRGEGRLCHLKMYQPTCGWELNITGKQANVKARIINNCLISVLSVPSSLFCRTARDRPRCRRTG